MGALLNRRRYMGGGSVLPYDAEIEYLESTGTQYINTGYYPNDTTILSAKYYNQPKAQSPFAARWSGDNTYDTFGIYISETNKTVVYYGRYSESKYNIITISSSYVIELNIGLTQITINGSTTNITRGAFTSTYPLYIFAMNNVGVVNFQSKTKLYKMTIKENDVTILDFIPVRVGTVGYMYDKISGIKYGNSGTGSFILGPDKT